MSVSAEQGDASRPTGRPPSMRTIVAAAMSGTAIEWYDFAIYGTAVTLVFGSEFFPDTGDPLDGILAGFVTYAVGFAARPLGGLVFGHYGDKLGRKRLLQISIVMIGTATFLMGTLPTFDTVGYLAPVLLVLLRFVQGFAVGGEWGGAVLLVAEHSPDDRRGFLSSFVQAAAPVGNVVAAAVLLLLSATLSDDAFLSWGWRIAFFLSGLIALVGFYIRSHVEDAPVFTQAREAASGEPDISPLREVVTRHPRTLVLAMGTKLVENIWYWIVATFSVTYLDAMDVETPNILLLLLAAQFLNVFVMIWVGSITDRWGRRRVSMAGVILAAGWAFVMFPLYDTGSFPLALVGICVGLVTWSVMYAPQSALLAEMFPTRVRYTGASVGYQLTTIVAGSLAPIIATGLLRRYDDSLPISLYVLAAAAISFVALLLVRDAHGQPWDRIDEPTSVSGRAGADGGPTTGGKA